MNKLYCTSCSRGCLLTIIGTGEYMAVEGNNCNEGVDFAKAECDEPHRMLTTTVRTEYPEVPVLPVRTESPIPQESFMDAFKEIKDVVVSSQLSIGDVIIEDVAETGIPVIVTSSALMHLGAELVNKNTELNRAGGSTGGEFEGMGGELENAGEEIPDSEKIGIVRNSLSDDGGVGEPGAVLDDLGDDDPVGGFVGAAGEAVGVDDPALGDEDYDDEGKPKGRSHIRIK